MKKFYSLLLALFVLSSVNAQVIFSEDFDGIGGPTSGGAGTYTFPAGWFLRNVDNSTPAGSVSYVNEAWERREDFANNVADSCAFSTSWYSPAATANDWMWTPLIGPIPANCVLKWNAITYDPSYPDGYEVRIMTSSQGPPSGGTGLIGNQITNSTTLFSTPAENTTWTARQVSLNAYAGQSVYIAFRNNATDEFLLLIDDVVVETQYTIDAQMQIADTATPYTLIPAPQGAPLNFNGTIRNNGVNALTNVSAQVNVFNGVTNVYSANSATTASLAAGATTNWTIPSFTATAIGNYTVQFIANQASGTDQQNNNDTLYQYFSVIDSTYARDNGTVVGSLGIGAGNGGYLGQGYDVYNTDYLTSIGVYYTRGYTGRPAALVVWNTVGGVPNTIIASTDTMIYPDDSARYYTLPISGGAISLTPGEYVVTAVEFDSTLAVGLTMDIFTANKTWVYWPTIPGGVWGNNEDFGSAFMRAYVIRPNFGDLCLNNAISTTTTTATCLTCADGSATTTATGTDGTVTYSWAPSGGNAATATGLLSGSYTVTATDGFGCVLMDTVTVAFDTCGGFTSTTSSVDASCATCADGSATISVTGGYGTLAYTWASSSNTTPTLSSLLPGSYTVTVVDSFGCTIVQTIIVNQSICGNVVITSDSTEASCSSCADGTAWVVVTGNNGPVTYLWSNSSTNDTITGVLPGTYTVLVTDSAGCTFNITVIVTSDICGDIASATSNTQATCATCTDGSATVTVTGSNGTLAYLWSNGGTTSTISNLLPGIYTVVVTDSAGCSISDTVTVPYDICSNLAVSVSSTTATCGTCPDGSATATVTGSNGTVTYLWSNGGTTATITNLLTGSYTVTVTDSAGCTYTDTVTVGFVDGIADANFQGSAYVYPNPNNGQFTVSFSFVNKTDAVVDVFNSLGQLMVSKQYDSMLNGRFDVNLENAAAGIYSVRIRTAEGVKVLPVSVR
ncbi:MAG: hypothetical protein FD123_4198 [Bacteroidetes bacterium]|nr:MAG: hypothetical protein FD123_4198 [Bacteroidota bacterium]